VRHHLSFLRHRPPIDNPRRTPFSHRLSWKQPANVLQPPPPQRSKDIAGMGRAEAGSVKAVSNQIKSKGLTRLRWYCQVCQKANRDANAMKMHCQSESHVRNMMIVSENQSSFLKQFSDEFAQAFVSLLRTSHGEKSVNANHFYNEYIADKNHLHMNATRWTSLTDFVKYLGREGICRVEEGEKGLHIAYVDNSPEAVRRREALRRKGLQEQGHERLDEKQIQAQIKRAQAARKDDEVDEEQRLLKREEGEKITLSFGAKAAAKADVGEALRREVSAASGDVGGESTDLAGAAEEPEEKAKPLAGFSMKMGAKPEKKNVFAAAKKNKPKASIEQPKKISEAERIMKEEMERKRSRDRVGFSMPSAKRHKTDR
jgi:DNA/RNA-binding protein KIN17